MPKCGKLHSRQSTTVLPVGRKLKLDRQQTCPDVMTQQTCEASMLPAAEQEADSNQGKKKKPAASFKKARMSIRANPLWRKLTRPGSNPNTNRASPTCQPQTSSQSHTLEGETNLSAGTVVS